MLTMDDVQGLWNDLKGVTSTALEYLRARPTDTKRIPVFQTVPIVFPITSGVFPQPREVTWVNPAGDMLITDIGHETFMEVLNADFQPTALNMTVPLVDSEIGLLVTSDQAIASLPARYPPIFDFEWNFKYGRDGAYYSVESMLGGTNRYCSRKSLGNRNRALMLGWTPEDPLVLLAGDSITWTILPTLLQFGTLTSLTIKSITVNLYMSGFRTGTPAEADYELR
jgi:hypothetical protein